MSEEKRWRAEMPDVDLYDGPSIAQDMRELAERTNAELDAAEAREAALTKERDELKAELNGWVCASPKHAMASDDGWRAEIAPKFVLYAMGLKGVVSAYEKLVKRANLELNKSELNRLAMELFGIRRRDGQTLQDCEVQFLDSCRVGLENENREKDERIAALESELAEEKHLNIEAESELAARRASDDDVRALLSFAGVKVGTEVGTREDSAVPRLLAAPWLKKEGN